MDDESVGGEIEPDDEQFEQAMGRLADLARWAQAEYIFQDGPDAAEKTQEAGDIARSAGDLVTARAMRRLVEKHGGGPCPPEEIAEITGRDVESVRRVLREMVRSGLAAPPKS